MKSFASALKPLSYAIVAVMGLFFGWNLSVSAAVLLPGNINTCGELAAPGTYTLTANIGSGGTCLTVTSDAVIIDGGDNGSGGHFTVTGDVSGSGVNEVGSGDYEADPGSYEVISGVTSPYSFTVRNVTVTGGVSSNGAGGYVSVGTGAGSITVLDSNVGNVSAFGGNATGNPFSEFGSSGGGAPGGTIVVINSVTGNLNVDGGGGFYGAPGLSPIGLYAGASAGAITVSSSTVGSISAEGGESNGPVSDGGAVIISGSSVVSVSAVGGYVSGGTGGVGGSVSIATSTLSGSIVATGGFGSSAGQGGSVSIATSSVGSVTSSGGEGQGSGGSGGGISIISSVVSGAVVSDGGAALGGPGTGGSVFVASSTVSGQVSSSGGNNLDLPSGSAGGNGGSVSIVSSQVEGGIYAVGRDGGGSQGSGGSISISGDDLDVSNLEISAAVGQDTCNGGCGSNGATNGSLSISYSNSLSTVNTTFSAFSSMTVDPPGSAVYGPAAFEGGSFPMLPSEPITSAGQCAALVFAGTYSVQSFVGDCLIGIDGVILDGGGTATVTGNVTGANGVPGTYDFDNYAVVSYPTGGISIALKDLLVTGNITAGSGAEGSSEFGVAGTGGGSVIISGGNINLSGNVISSGPGGDDGCSGQCAGLGSRGSVTLTYEGITTNPSTQVFTGASDFNVNGIIQSGWNGVFNPLIYYFYDGPTAIQPGALMDGNWANAANWYTASDYSVQDENLPGVVDEVIIRSSVTQNTGSSAAVYLVSVSGDSLIDIDVDAGRGIVFNDSSSNGGLLSTSLATFNGSSTNNGSFGAPDLPGTFSDNLIAYWALDEESGDRLDVVGDYTLYPNNAVGSSAGKSGRAAVLNASSWLSSDHHFDLSGGFTVSSWIRRTSPTSNSPAISQWLYGNGGFYLGAGSNFTTGDDIFFDVSGDTATLTYPASNDWTYVTAAYDPLGEARLYVNGVLVDSTDSFPLSDDGDATFKLGTLDAGGEFTYNGKIDEVNLWGRALTDLEIQAVYRNKNAGSYANDLVFSGDDSNNNGTTTGSVTRLFASPVTTVRNFLTDGNRNNWIVVAQGVVVDLTNAVYDVATNVFKALAGGWFIPNPTINGGAHVVPLISISTSTIAYTGVSNTRTIKWKPLIDWDTATTCLYSYDNFVTTNPVTCSTADATLPRPAAGQHPFPSGARTQTVE